jgi:hypothetical protein
MKGAVRNANATHAPPAAAHANANDSQVGARQAALRLSPPGGGYQDVCNTSNAALSAPAAAADPRVAELRRVGLPKVWIRVAQEAGYDAFMVMWRVLMQGGHVDDRCRVVVPNYSRYLRYQRNQLVRQLIADGHGIPEIQHQVEQSTGETISEYYIRRAVARA